jgi:hypothetical protein
MTRDDLWGGLTQIWPVTQHAVSFPRRAHVRFEQIPPPPSPDRAGA